MAVTHVMVDLETAGVNKRAAILAIGACRFDIANPHIGLGTSFYVNVNLQSSIDAGLEVDGKTIYWWLNQTSPEARAQLEDPAPEDLDKALLLFSSWLNKTSRYLSSEAEELRIWSQHTHFDIAVLEEAYRATKITIPWSHRDVLDLPTLVTIANWPKDDKGKSVIEVEANVFAHNALADARHQASQAQASYHRLNPDLS